MILKLKNTDQDFITTFIRWLIAMNKVKEYFS